MCEIDPKRARYFTLEFFTAHDMTDERWDELTLVDVLEVEQQLNKTGEIRAHIHEREDDEEVGQNVRIVVGAEARGTESGKIIATGLLSDGVTRYYVVEVCDGDARVIYNGDFNVV